MFFAVTVSFKTQFYQLGSHWMSTNSSNIKFAFSSVFRRDSRKHRNIFVCFCLRRAEGMQQKLKVFESSLKHVYNKTTMFCDVIILSSRSDKKLCVTGLIDKTETILT